MNVSFDYVIAGAGTAGCVLARRLLERTDATVALLEVGGPADRDEVIRADIPAVTSLWGNPEVAWLHRTVPQPGLGGREVDIPQGRVVGGSGSINALMYVRGNPGDFDHWRSLGNPRWGYADLLPYFKAAERYEGGPSSLRGGTGPLHVARYREPSQATKAFLSAATKLGYADGDWDYNGDRQAGGAFVYQSTREGGERRSSTATAYLEPVLTDRRLTVVTGTLIDRVELAGTKAVGVRLAPGGDLVRASREVIVSCGTLSSPAVLMRSGIGPPAHLAEHGIDPRVILPGVGQNLHDHLLVGVGYASQVDLAPPELIAEGGLFTEISHDVPELQFFFGPVQFIDDEYRTEGPGFTFAPVLLHPRSRGELLLRSAHPAELPLVNPRYLEQEADVRVLVRGISLARELAATPAFTGIRDRELAPGPDTDLVSYVRRSATTVWHPVGTCAMGSGDAAVVDAELRVHGVTGLRVVDASIMPAITSGNTNAPTIMIAERAADLITASGEGLIAAGGER
ncbi:MAG: GMC family oxidoreductase N-terminal domain-containing protein [Streptosporangiaceae bacterium]|nr:GMC family oxidoreductase N-terminal domain-containing protein [Streptosporangiaceae bacterium]